uniref:Arrestin-C n=1 Tax=Scleropages formosus TaxID=113540 RepID=A0A8C9R854_SCLFO
MVVFIVQSQAQFCRDLNQQPCGISARFTGILAKQNKVVSVLSHPTPAVCDDATHLCVTLASSCFLFLSQLSLYLGRRDFVDHIETMDDVGESLLLLSHFPTLFFHRHLWVQLACAFRYGRDDLDVIGLSFRKDIWIQCNQIYPPTNDPKPPNTPLQEMLLKKTGEQGYPFTFKLPNNLPCSVSMLPGPEDAGKPCGVDFEAKAFIAHERDNPEEKVEKKYVLARVMVNYYSSSKSSFAELQAVLLHIYYHGDPITIRVKINNETSMVVKKIIINIYQMTDVMLYSADKYSKCVLNEEFGDQVNGNSTFEKAYQVTPLLANNKEKRGLALDGKLKDEDTNLASTTLLRPGMDKEILGILVSYKIKVTLTISRAHLLLLLHPNSDVGVELPLVLMSPKPAGEGLPYHSGLQGL